MRPKSILLLALALGCGLVAAVGIGQVLDRSKSQESVATVPIFVAKMNIPFGQKITEEMVRVEQWPESKVPPGAVGTIEDIVDQMPRTAILPGYPIVQDALGGDDSRASTGIPEGYQTVPIKLTADQGGNLLKVGDRVDVQVYLRKGAAPGINTAMIKTIYRNVPVFAVDQQFQNRADDNGKGAGANPVITLQVKPDQARGINLAKSVGSILLTMRSVTDNSVETSDSLSVRDLLNLSGEGDAPIVATTDKPSGLEQLLDQEQERSSTTTPGRINDDSEFVMIKWVQGEPVRYTFGDPTQLPRELSGSAMQSGLPQTNQLESDPLNDEDSQGGHSQNDDEETDGESNPMSADE